MFDSKKGVAALAIGTNTALTLLKLGVGISIGSVGVLAEGIHSGLDLLAAIIAYFAVRQSAKPADDKYPYGRGKVENVSGTIEALLIFVAAGIIIYEAVQKLVYGFELQYVDWGLGAMACSVLVNVVVSRLILRVARRTDSVALEADAYHLTTDVLTSMGVLVALAVVRFTGWTILDPIVALAVAAAILKAVWEITHRAFIPLLDRSLPEEDRAFVEEVLSKPDDRIHGFHKVRTRKSGSDKHIDLHLVVSGDLHVSEAHDLCDDLERQMREGLSNCSLTIHVEPCGLTCDYCSADQQSSGTRRTDGRVPLTSSAGHDSARIEGTNTAHGAMETQLPQDCPTDARAADENWGAATHAHDHHGHHHHH